MARQPEVDIEEQHGAAVLVQTQRKTKPPVRYKVLLHNDDYTSMDFVVSILQMVFHRSNDEAYRIMLHVHRHGTGVAGVYPYEIAETKAKKAIDLARLADFPLQCSVEQE